MGTGERPGTVVLTDTQTSPISSAWSGPVAIGNLSLTAPQDQDVSFESWAVWEGSSSSQRNHEALLLLCIPSRHGPPRISKPPFSLLEAPPTGASHLTLCFSFLPPFLSCSHVSLASFPVGLEITGNVKIISSLSPGILA